MITKDRDSKGVERVRASLWQQDLGTVVTDARSPWSAANEKKGFTAFKVSMGGRPEFVPTAEQQKAPAPPPPKPRPV